MIGIRLPNNTSIIFSIYNLITKNISLKQVFEVHEMRNWNFLQHDKMDVAYQQHFLLLHPSILFISQAPLPCFVQLLNFFTCLSKNYLDKPASAKNILNVFYNFNFATFFLNSEWQRIPKIIDNIWHMCCLRTRFYFFS